MAIRKHRYRVTVEHLAAPHDGAPLHAPLAFEAVNHDEILGVAERVRGHLDLGQEDATALAIGMKLFGEVMLTHRDNPLFAELRPAWREFVGALKAQRPKDGAARVEAGAD